MIRRTEQRAVPLPGERLPVKIPRGGLATFASPGAATMLMHYDPTERLDLFRNPKMISDTELQAVRRLERSILDFEVLSCTEDVQRGKAGNNKARDKQA